MRVQRYRDTGIFLDRARPFLLRAEAENNLLLGMGVRIFDEQCYLAAVEDAGEVVACAARTPPYGLVITRTGARALDALIGDVAEKYEALPSVMGPEPTVSDFAERWTRRTGGRVRHVMRMRLFETRQVRTPALVPPGRLRLAADVELPTITAWVTAFHREARTGDPLDPARATHEDVANRRLYVWDDQGPVSIAAYGSRTARSARIVLAYTPPAHRRHGYASALVAGLTQHLLNEGAVFCCINTDLTNPTTNRIYPALGYRQVCDASTIDLNAV